MPCRRFYHSPGLQLCLIEAVNYCFQVFVEAASLLHYFLLRECNRDAQVGKSNLTFFYDVIAAVVRCVQKCFSFVTVAALSSVVCSKLLTQQSVRCLGCLVPFLDLHCPDGQHLQLVSAGMTNKAFKLLHEKLWQARQRYLDLRNPALEVPNYLHCIELGPKLASTLQIAVKNNLADIAVNFVGRSRKLWRAQVSFQRSESILWITSEVDTSIDYPQLRRP